MARPQGDLPAEDSGGALPTQPHSNAAIERGMPPQAESPVPDEELFSRNVLRRVLELAAQCQKSTLIVLSKVEELKAVMGARNNPEVDRRWRGTNIMEMSPDKESLSDRCLDGIVAVHPTRGTVCAVTARLSPRDRPEWTLPMAIDGGTGGNRIKTALYLSMQIACVVIILKRKPDSVWEAVRQGWLSVFTSPSSAKVPPEFFCNRTPSSESAQRMHAAMFGRARTGSAACITGRLRRRGQVISIETSDNGVISLIESIGLGLSRYVDVGYVEVVGVKNGNGALKADKVRPLGEGLDMPLWNSAVDMMNHPRVRHLFVP